MSVDPRTLVKNLLLGVTATLDDDVTGADIIVMFQGGPETYLYLFNVTDFDVVIDVERHEEREAAPDRRIQDVPLRYPVMVPVHVTAVDKTTMTATLVLEKVRKSIINVIETNAQSADYTFIVERDQSNNQRLGGMDPLWRDDYRITVRPMEGT